MKQLLTLLTAAVVTGGMVGLSPASATPRSGAMNISKECSQYGGAVGDFCTITASNVDAIKVGSKVVYAQPPNADGSLDSDIVVTDGRGSRIFGHVTLNPTTMIITFSGGTGQFVHFSASADVTVTDGGTPAELWHWDGQYTFGTG
jgi:hypothetical protein